MTATRAIVVAGTSAFLVACASAKTKKAQHARDAAKVQAAREAALPRPAVALYIQDATFRFGQVWQRFLEQYGDRLPNGAHVVVVIEVTREGHVAGLRYEQPSENAYILERGIEAALAATQFDPFSEEMQRELGQTASVQFRIPVSVR